MRISLVAAACLFACAAVPAGAQTVTNLQNYSTSLTTAPMVLMPANPVRNYLHIMNVGLSGAASAWCSYWTTSPAANAPGSFEVAPGSPNGLELNSAASAAAGSMVPTMAISCVAASGTVPLTAEAR